MALCRWKRRSSRATSCLLTSSCHTLSNRSPGAMSYCGACFIPFHSCQLELGLITSYNLYPQISSLSQNPWYSWCYSKASVWGAQRRRLPLQSHHWSATVIISGGCQRSSELPLLGAHPSVRCVRQDVLRCCRLIEKKWENRNTCLRLMSALVSTWLCLKFKVYLVHS